MKSFPITREMREDIARELTSRAIGAEVTAFARECKRLNTKFWKMHAARLRKETGIPATKWTNLIQIGFARPTCAEYPQILTPGENPRWDYPFTTSSDRTHEWLREHINPSTFEKLTGYLSSPRYSNRGMVLVFRHDVSVPSIDNCNRVSDKALIKEMIALGERLEKLIDAAHEFREKVMSLLLSCRTSKQMQELFPEGAKLLPPPPVKDTGLAPAGLAESVTAMLKKGVPPVLETAK